MSTSSGVSSEEDLNINGISTVLLSSDSDDPTDQTAVELETINMPGPTDKNDGPSSRFSDLDIESNAGLITQILTPVCITMILVIGIVKTISFPWQDSVSQAMIYHESANDDGWKRFLGALLNAGIFVAMMIVVTVIFVICYKYRCLKFIFAWLGLSTLMLLAMFGGYLLYEVLSAFNIPMDYFTFSILIWNLSAVGILSIFWHAPMRVNQGYLIFISAILAIVFTRLPEWTTWTVLAAIAIYDLFAVLCPGGPLRVLVETAQERNEPIPALIYSASLWMMMSNSEPSGSGSGSGSGISDSESEHDKKEEENAAPKDEDSDDQPKSSGVKLGLGDFVFYSVLVGRAALFDMLTVFTSFIGIVAGLFLTILLLALWKKALPALPISILFGILFFFITKFCLLSFTSDLVLKGVVI